MFSGVGKSTFARKLGERNGIGVTHLDAIYWKPGWVEAPTDEFRGAQQENVQREKWIIEGNYSSSIDIREPLADTVIYLELPLYVCLYRVVKRRIQFHGKTRNDIGKDCPEKIDWTFVKFILTTYKRRKKTMFHRLQHYANEGKTVHVLRNEKQIAGFLNQCTLKRNRR
ncbi:topology modulation protein [Sporosarcina sp. USHLN248]|uniref:topology modulation protein n=1 Tax=Sporosarcina sp. USHLN248 TaxID=3081300 RepID=UPI003019EB97